MFSALRSPAGKNLIIRKTSWSPALCNNFFLWKNIGQSILVVNLMMGKFVSREAFSRSRNIKAYRKALETTQRKNCISKLND